MFVGGIMVEKKKQKKTVEKTRPIEWNAELFRIQRVIAIRGVRFLATKFQREAGLKYKQQDYTKIPPSSLHSGTPFQFSQDIKYIYMYISI